MVDDERVGLLDAAGEVGFGVGVQGGDVGQVAEDAALRFERVGQEVGDEDLEPLGQLFTHVPGIVLP